MIRGVPFRVGTTPSGLTWAVGSAPMSAGGVATVQGEGWTKDQCYAQVRRIVQELERLNAAVLAHRAATEGPHAQHVHPGALVRGMGSIGCAPPRHPSFAPLEDWYAEQRPFAPAQGSAIPHRGWRVPVHLPRPPETPGQFRGGRALIYDYPATPATVGPRPGLFTGPYAAPPAPSSWRGAHAASQILPQEMPVQILGSPGYDLEQPVAVARVDWPDHARLLQYEHARQIPYGRGSW